MGCAHFSWQPSLTNAIDVMVTRSHGLQDAHADELADWVCDVCRKSGLRSFYKPGLSGSSALEGGRRRLLRDAFELANCVAAVAVAVAIQTERQAQLANEIVWAAQHSKPIILMYDSSKPFDMNAWQESFPELFPSHVVRYYGKGHEECAAELTRAIQTKAVRDAGARAEATPRMVEVSEPTEQPSEPKAPCPEAWQAALERLRSAQPSDLPKVSFKGILRNRERWTKRQSPAAFLDREVQEAVRFVMGSLPISSEDAALELLCASVGVSERVVSASLRILAVRMNDMAPQLDLLQEVFAWSLAAVHRHVDSVDVCTFGMDCLQISYGLMLSMGEKPMKICSTEAEQIVSALRSFPACHMLQRNGFTLLRQLLECPNSFRVQDAGDAIALPGGGLARILTREGVAEMALKAIGPGDPSFLRDACKVLQVLSVSSRHVKEQGSYSGAPAFLFVPLKHAGIPRLLWGPAMSTWLQLLQHTERICLWLLRPV